MACIPASWHKANQYQDTNVAFTFLDVAGKKYYTTNGFWHGKWLTESNYDDFTTVIYALKTFFIQFLQR